MRSSGVHISVDTDDLGCLEVYFDIHTFKINCKSMHSLKHSRSLIVMQLKVWKAEIFLLCSGKRSSERKDHHLGNTAQNSQCSSDSQRAVQPQCTSGGFPELREDRH